MKKELVRGFITLNDLIITNCLCDILIRANIEKLPVCSLFKFRDADTNVSPFQERPTAKEPLASGKEPGHSSINKVSLD